MGTIVQNWEALRSYRYRFFSAPGKLNASLILVLTADLEARLLAKELLKASTCSTVFLYRENSLIFSMGHDALPTDQPARAAAA